MSGNRFKNRSYVWISRDESGQAYEVPIYAPADSTLTGITFYSEPTPNDQGQIVDVEQYSLSFQVSCEVSYGYDHILRLSDQIRALAPTEPATTTRDAEAKTDLPLKAGDLIGYTTGTISAHNWDFLALNSSRSNQFANQDRYESAGDLGSLVIGDCPYDYFSEELRNEYYLLLSGHGGLRDGDDCFVSPDHPGTIAGGWFKEPFSTETFEGFDPGWGLTVGFTAYNQVRVVAEHDSVWVDAGLPTYMDPKTLTEHCYLQPGDPDRFVYLKLLSDMELAAAFGQGSCWGQLPCPNTRLITGRYRAAAGSRPRPGDRFLCDTLVILIRQRPHATNPTLRVRFVAVYGSSTGRAFDLSRKIMIC